MRKGLLFILGLVVGLCLVAGGYFAFNNLSGSEIKIVKNISQLSASHHRRPGVFIPWLPWKHWQSYLFTIIAYSYLRINLSSVPMSSDTNRSTLIWRSYFSRREAMVFIIGEAWWLSIAAWSLQLSMSRMVSGSSSDE